MSVVVEEFFALVFLDGEWFAWFAVEVVDADLVPCRCSFVLFELTGYCDGAFLVEVVSELPGVVVDAVFVDDALDLVGVVAEDDEHQVFLFSDAIHPAFDGDSGACCVVCEEIVYVYVFHVAEVRQALLNS